MRPVGPNIPEELSAILDDMQNAILALQNPGRPQRMCAFALKADLPTASDWPERAAICDEINSIVVSTEVAGVYAWLRSDGSAL